MMESGRSFRRLAYPLEDYKWVVRLYYKDDVKPPKIPGELAMEIVLVDDVAKDVEVEISEMRGDVIVEVNTNPKWRGW